MLDALSTVAKKGKTLNGGVLDIAPFGIFVDQKVQPKMKKYSSPAVAKANPLRLSSRCRQRVCSEWTESKRGTCTPIARIKNGMRSSNANCKKQSLYYFSAVQPFLQLTTFGALNWSKHANVANASWES